MDKKLKLDWFKGYKPKNGTVVIQVVEKTTSGIILVNTNEYADKQLVVAIAPDVEIVEPGEHILGVGNVLPLTVNGKPYLQVYASSIMGVVEPDAEVSSNIEPIRG